MLKLFADKPLPPNNLAKENEGKENLNNLLIAKI